MRRALETTDRPLRIGLNLVFLGERAGGIGRYATELPGALLAAAPETELHVFVSRDCPARLREEAWAGSVRWATLPVGIGHPVLPVAAQFAALPALARARGLDVLHSPANTGPVITPGLASVISLHDLIWLHRASEWEASRVVQRRMRVLVGHCVRHADRIFADSHDAAQDFTQTLGVARERIDVTPLGVRAPARLPSVPEAQMRARLQLGASRVLLCVAQKRPYKNLQALIRALPRLEEEVVLVLPGSPTAHERELLALADELDVRARVRFPAWLSDEELESLYAISEVFVLPSLIEGFGIPVLEAMAHGVPVACARVSALPEVAGEAALLFDPLSQDELVAAVRRILEDPALARRLVERGRERAARFSWRRTGEASIAGYRRAVAGAQGRVLASDASGAPG
ncbi:MAG TPA: glycosyltransferase family 1 protein [Solirubrobacteraceae bacterium]|nr:glycosyltransferase family 1 protein [Solirubrobacteraceae bacterium]